MNRPTPHEFEQAVQRLEQGRLVAFPTETVYGLGGDALNPRAIEAIFRLKGRPADHPLIAHVGSLEQAVRLAAVCPSPALELMNRFWPGPLTVVLPKSDLVPWELTGGQSSVAIRMPNHPVALELLRRFSKPLAAPSANRYGRISPTTCAHVRAEFEGDDLPVLDGGECDIGIESTIVSLVAEPLLLRPGHIGLEALRAILPDLRLAATHEGPRASGRTISHYAPTTPLRLVQTLAHASHRDAVLAFTAKPAHHEGVWIQAPMDPRVYAHHLYDWLHRLDAAGAHTIYVCQVPQSPEWDAIADRLSRASAGA